jgi:hypothetical protein
MHKDGDGEKGDIGGMDKSKVVVEKKKRISKNYAGI